MTTEETSGFVWDEGHSQANQLIENIEKVRAEVEQSNRPHDASTLGSVYGKRCADRSRDCLVHSLV
jgi:hypothetical protein